MLKREHIIWFIRPKFGNSWIELTANSNCSDIFIHIFYDNDVFIQCTRVFFVWLNPVSLNYSHPNYLKSINFFLRNNRIWNSNRFKIQWLKKTKNLRMKLMIDDGCGKIFSKSIFYKPNQFPVFAPELWKIQLRINNCQTFSKWQSLFAMSQTYFNTLTSIKYSFQDWNIVLNVSLFNQDNHMIYSLYVSIVHAEQKHNKNGNNTKKNITIGIFIVAVKLWCRSKDKGIALAAF